MPPRLGMRGAVHDFLLELESVVDAVGSHNTAPCRRAVVRRLLAFKRPPHVAAGNRAIAWVFAHHAFAGVWCRRQDGRARTIQDRVGRRSMCIAGVRACEQEREGLLHRRARIPAAQPLPSWHRGGLSPRRDVQMWGQLGSSAARQASARICTLTDRLRSSEAFTIHSAARLDMRARAR